jgi:pimeloyl-ACP methyl ester carboxylesterase
MPAVLLHGLLGQARNLGRLARALSTERTVLAMDLRSHGSSPSGPLAPRDMANDVVETMRAAGIGRASLVGHSLGGKVAMAVALGHPDVAERLVVADMAPTAQRRGNERFVAALRRMTLTPGLTRAAADAALAGEIEDRAVRGWLLANLEPGDVPRWRLGLDAIEGSIDQAEGWPDWPAGTRFEGPALFLRGGASDYVPDAAWPGIVALFPAATLATIEGAGHWLHVEQPEAFQAAVAAFLA